MVVKPPDSKSGAYANFATSRMKEKSQLIYGGLTGVPPSFPFLKKGPRYAMQIV